LLGTEVVAELEARGHDVVALSRAEFDVSEPEHAARLAAEEFGKPDWIVNCAAYTAVDKAESEEHLATDINGLGVGYLARGASSLNARILHISTDFVFDGTSTIPYTEEDKVNPLGAYGRSKLMGERALEGNHRAVVVRTSWLFGPNGACFPRTMLNAHRKGKNLRVVTDQRGNPTYTPHLAKVLAGIVEKDPFPGLYHAAGPETVSWYEFAKRTLEECTGDPVSIEAIKTEDWPTPAKRPPFSALDSCKLAKEGIGPMPPLSEAIKEFCSKVR
jgi:dTDP-4-dehydrorhamnose reductase